MKNKLRYVILFIMGLLLLFLAGYYYFNRRSVWIHPHRGNVVQAIYGLGTVTSNKFYHLKVGITTSVMELFVSEGQTVTKDQKLVKFNDLPIIKAPFSGVVTALPLYLHETVYPQDTVLTITDLADRYILVSLPQKAALKIAKGQKVKLLFDGLDNTLFYGYVDSIYPKNHEFYVKIIVDNLPKNILPDMNADVAIIIQSRENVLLVPASSIDGDFITIRSKSGHIKKLKVNIGFRSNNDIEVDSKQLSTQDFILAKKD